MGERTLVVDAFKYLVGSPMFLYAVDDAARALSKTARDAVHAALMHILLNTRLLHSMFARLMDFQFFVHGDEDPAQVLSGDDLATALQRLYVFDHVRAARARWWWWGEARAHLPQGIAYARTLLRDVVLAIVRADTAWDRELQARLRSSLLFLLSTRCPGS